MILALPDKVIRYRDNFRRRYSIDVIVKYIECLRDLRVLVLGEVILDEYVYCDALGKSGKDAMLVMKYLSQERYAGGILAVANHLADFCDNIQMISYLGAKNPQEDFVRAHLKRTNIEPTFIYKQNSPTIVKRRFLDSYTRSKLLGIYDINDNFLNHEEECELCAILNKHLPNTDIAIVVDYDHGLITPAVVKLLADKASFMAINTQINAANIGFHSISKYNRADFICTNENEIRMDRRNRNDDLKDLIRDLSRRMNCGRIMITRGTHGTLLYWEGEGFTECPAFAMKVIDRIGAGDAVLSLSSLMAAKEIPPDVISFAANIVGAEAVKIIGNKRSIDKSQLTNSIRSFMT